jgi:hypothetical protein
MYSENPFRKVHPEFSGITIFISPAENTMLQWEYKIMEANPEHQKTF